MMASIWTTRTRFLLLAAGVLLAASLAREGWEWYAYADERRALTRMTSEIESAALTLMRTQLAADSLRGVIEETDARLRRHRLDLDRIERRADGGGLPPALYRAYRRGLEQYNQRIVGRNAEYTRWREIVQRNHGAVDRYNVLADSMRLLGTRMGEPYLAIPSPSEVAVRHGLGPGTHP